MSQLGSITEESVRSYFRFESFELISNVLSTVDNNPLKAFGYLDQLVNKESPTWIKDHIIMAIASALRSEVGAKPTFLVPTNFFGVRGRAWINVANELSRIDKVNMSDIESVLLKDSMSILEVPRVQTEIKNQPEPEAVKEKPEEKKPDAVAKEEPPKPKPIVINIGTPSVSVKNKEVVIDGINFSSNEILTSLDKKLEKTPVQPKNNSGPVLQVELNTDHAPINEKDFTESLLSCLRG
jgi:hypothetical protein